MTKTITQHDIDAARRDLFRRRRMRKGGVPQARAHLQSLIDTALKQRFDAPATLGARFRAAWRLILGEAA